MAFPIMVLRTPQTLNIKSDLSFKLMVISNNEDPEFFINKYVDLSKSYSDDLNQFTGNIQTLDEHGEILASRWYDQGLFLSDLKNPESSPDSGLIQQRMALNRSYIIVRTLMTTGWYTEDGGGGWRKTHTTNNGYREEVIWNQDDYYLYEFWARSGAVDTSRGGGNGPYGTTYTGITSREEATIKKIEDRRRYEIINELTGKAECINDLLTEKGTNFIRNLLVNFEGNSEFHINIKSAPILINPVTKKESGGLTYPPDSNNKILIEISSSSIIKKSALEAAKTILHEYIHADIHRKLKTLNNTDQGILNFQATYNAYKEQFKGNIDASPQHQTMGYLYVNSMRDALKGFHKNVLKADYAKYVKFNGQEPSDLFYEALAWRGLKEHNVEAYKDIDPEKIKQLEAVDLDIDFLTQDCNNAQ